MCTISRSTRIPKGYASVTHRTERRTGATQHFHLRGSTESLLITGAIFGSICGCSWLQLRPIHSAMTRSPSQGTPPEHDYSTSTSATATEKFPPVLSPISEPETNSSWTITTSPLQRYSGASPTTFDVSADPNLRTWTASRVTWAIITTDFLTAVFTHGFLQLPLVFQWFVKHATLLVEARFGTKEHIEGKDVLLITAVVLLVLRWSSPDVFQGNGLLRLSIWLARLEVRLDSVFAQSAMLILRRYSYGLSQASSF